MGGATGALDMMVERPELEARILELEQELSVVRGKPSRHRMPDTRMSLTIASRLPARRLHHGRFVRRRMPGELFVTMSKEGARSAV